MRTPLHSAIYFSKNYALDLYGEFVFSKINCYSSRMFSALNKKLTWVIVIWFAVLQMLSPLIHAHIAGDTPAQGHGLHMHMQELEQVQDKIPTLKNTTGDLHTISVDKALVKDKYLFVSPLLAVLFVLCSLLVVKRSSKPGFSFLSPPPFYLRRRFRPRAPPSFLN